MDRYSEILEYAYAYGKAKFSEVNDAYHAAFANSVAYIVTGWSGGYGGPSMREHWATRVAHQRNLGSASWEHIYDVVEDICYGPMTKDIAKMMTLESCRDDSSQDTEDAKQMLAD